MIIIHLYFFGQNLDRLCMRGEMSTLNSIFDICNTARKDSIGTDQLKTLFQVNYAGIV